MFQQEKENIRMLRGPSEKIKRRGMFEDHDVKVQPPCISLGTQNFDFSSLALEPCVFH